MAEPTNPLNEFRPFNEETLEDALVPIRERFGEGACELARKHLRNPLRKQCNDLGTVGYRKGKPVCFQVACIRRLYWKQQEIFGIVGGLTCRTFKGCPPSVTFETIERAEAPRLGSIIGFGNSCCVETATMDEGKGSVVGPESCSRSLWTVVHPLQCLLYLARRKLFKMSIPPWTRFDTKKGCDFSFRRGGILFCRLTSFDPGFFDVLQGEYLKTNEGLFCSRTAEELEWIFGERVRSGECVVLCGYENDKPCGYILLQYYFDRRRCEVMDMFALNNDERIIDALIVAARRYLRSYTPIMVLELFGFPSCIQAVLKRTFRFVQKKSCNKFSWSVSGDGVKEIIPQIVDSKKSWFFGPYDGDYCLG